MLQGRKRGRKREEKEMYKKDPKFLHLMHFKH